MQSDTAPGGVRTAYAVLDGAVRVTIAGRHVVPVVCAWAGLLRAERDRARGGAKRLVLLGAMAVTGGLVAVAALSTGAVLGLRELGWPVWAATALPTAAGLAAAIAAGALGYTRLVHVTFPETRRRIGALLEILDEP